MKPFLLLTYFVADSKRKNLETIVNGDSYLGELNKKHNSN